MSHLRSEKHFTFSVVMPVYNKEEYLEEAFESLERQTIGFEANIQVILINDGSTDSSPEICESICSRYPENVFYINQDNAGVSRARNEGLAHATGDFITFFDSDDIWDLNAFEVAFEFFAEHKGETDVLAIRLVHFGDITSRHVLDYKYEGISGVVDLNKHPEFVQSMIGNCFFEKASLAGLQFREDIHCAEDTLFVNEVFLEKCTCGVSADSTYRYRKIKSANTASMSRDKLRYKENNDACMLLYGASKRKLGYIAHFVSFVGLYELCWQVLAKCDGGFTEAERKQWHSIVSEILDPVNDEDICSAPWLTIAKRLCLLELKHGDGFLKSIPWDASGKWIVDGACLLSLKKFPCIVLNSMRVRGDQLVVHGVTRVTFFDEEASLRVRIGKTDRISLDLTPSPSDDQVLITGETALRAYRFSFSLPLRDVLERTVSIVWERGEGQRIALPIRCTLYGGIPINKSYSAQDEVVIQRPKVSKIKVRKRSLKTHASSEYTLIKRICSSSELGFWDKTRIVGLRVAAKLYQVFKRKPIWIFIDREYKAGDSAEALYDYARRQPSVRDVDLSFLQKKTSADYRRLKSKGSVLRPGSLRFHVKFLSAQKVLSGHHDSMVTNPFGAQGRYFADMYLFDFYNLSHGTLQGDLSAQLNRHVRPIHRFFVSSEMERDALLGDSYGYSEEEVCLSGMCRYDVYDKEKTCKKIIFMPTWRASLAGAIIPGTRERELIPDFEESDYCRAYNALINDERLLSMMRDAGYTGEFYVHPNYEKQAACFHGNDVIKVSESSADYNRALSEGALLVTDYSGISFDFAYMRKPVLYYHFDNLFNGEHSYKENYFNYDDQGFGPVCCDQSEIVTAIGDFLEQGAEMAPQFRRRADAFFAFNDRSNCERVFDVIMSESR